MATFIKGDAVANATSYELIEKIEPVAGEATTNTYSDAGYVLASTGALTGSTSTWVYSPFIKLSELADNADGICVEKFISHGTVAAISYYTEADFNSWLSAMTFAQVGKASATAEAVRSNAPDGAVYVVFSTDGSKATLEVTTAASGDGETTYEVRATKNEINFEVSALGLSAGNHTLVVKAKADGYEDSDYSNELVYTAT